MIPFFAISIFKMQMPKHEIAGTHRSNIDSEKDSIELLNLVRNFYGELNKWRTNNEFAFLPLKYDMGNRIIMGIDWELHERDLAHLRNSNFFTDDFLITYDSIALNLDISIKKSDLENRINEGIPFWAFCSCDIWTNSQYEPEENWWNNLNIDHLSFKDEKATFYWNWIANQETGEKHEYRIDA